MNEIKVKSSIALDVLCYIEKRLLDDTRWMNEKQTEEIKYINNLLPSDFDNTYIGMSNICHIISAYVDGDLESLTLDDLILIFRSPRKIKAVVKEKIGNGFTASFLSPVLGWLNDGFAETYVKQLTALKNIGFEDLYRERILPLVLEEIEQKQNEVAGYDAADLFERISVLKTSPKINSTNIYVSFFSAPTAFSLCGGSFLTCFCPPNSIDFYSIIAHELMHGFASTELTKLYRTYTESDEHLKNCHHALIKKYHSGDEEEFVMAAEYYLCYLSGNYTKEQLLLKAQERYGGNCPTSVFLFELLTQEPKIPANYNEWLTRQFERMISSKEKN